VSSFGVFGYWFAAGLFVFTAVISWIRGLRSERGRLRLLSLLAGFCCLLASIVILATLYSLTR